MTIILLLAGILLLVAGADIFVKGAASIANMVGITPLVIGLTVVAWGTSLPELVVSVSASLESNGEISFGNVVGSNIFNVLFILGLSALVTPLVVSRQLIKLDVPIMIICSFLVLAIGYDGRISRFDGILLLIGLTGYTALLFIIGRKEIRSAPEEYEKEYGNTKDRLSKQGLTIKILMIICGLILLVIGSRWVVDSAQLIALELGVNELVIGLTIVAAGTSLPEVATSVIASLRGERDIAVGNIVGSNIFNILGVLGLATIFAPAGISLSGPSLYFDIPVMIAVALACLPIFFTRNLIARWEGGLFLAYYAAYIFYLILSAAKHHFLQSYTMAMLFFVIPITMITFGIILLRGLSSELFKKK